MTNRPTTLALSSALALAFAAGAAQALTPAQVLVVGNEASPESAELARYYAVARGIPKDNVLLIRTSLGMDVSREEYDTQIRGPIRKALIDRKLKDSIRCICLVWGVPLRAAGLKDTPEEKVRTIARAAATKMHYRLAVADKLAATIGRDFAEPRTQGLSPLAALFATPPPASPEPLPSVGHLRDELHKLLAAKEIEVGKIQDPAKRKIAVRQLMALHQELGGTQGLFDHIRDTHPADAPSAQDLTTVLDGINTRLAQLTGARPQAENIEEILNLVERGGGVLTAASYIDKLLEQLKNAEMMSKSEAAVDSELALLWWDNYPLRGAAANPLHWQARRGAAGAAAGGAAGGAGPGGSPPVTLMTSRIDGPTCPDATRMVKFSLSAEAQGLQGTFYIDAGGPARVPAPARNQFDARLLKLDAYVRGHARIQVVLDDKPTCFPPKSCPNAAVYVGWYSLQNYIPAFTWVPGAVGYHVASWEAVHLRDPQSQEWCVKMIQNGVAATLGAVSEPLLNHFPNPEEFFPLLLTGKYTMAEVYWRTIPAASWQVVLFADPLYTPFKANPQVKEADLPAGLAP
jgi:uncharacterized protein (TIGR03790 family)